MTQYTEAKNIYQRIAFEALIEINLAADSRDTDAVSVMCNATYHASKQSAVCSDLFLSIFCGGRRVACAADTGVATLFCYWPKAQRVQAKLWARAHGENVTDDTAHTGRCALERLDGAGMIVALHFERHCPAITDIHDTGILFARFDQNFRTGGGKFSQFFPRIFVRAVFAPHD